MLGCCESEIFHSKKESEISPSLDLIKINRQMYMLLCSYFIYLSKFMGASYFPHFSLIQIFCLRSLVSTDDLLIIYYIFLITATCRASFHPICAREAGNRLEIWGKHGCDTVSFITYRTES